MKIILKIIYNFLLILDRIIERFFKKSFLYYLKDLFEKDLYIKKEILNKKISFYMFLIKPQNGELKPFMKKSQRL